MATTTDDGFLSTTGAISPQMWDRDDHMDWGGGTWIAMLVMMSVFWVGLLGVAAWGIHVFGTRSHHAPVASASAIEIAKQRYARGDIGEEEFERIKRNVI